MGPRKGVFPADSNPSIHVGVGSRIALISETHAWAYLLLLPSFLLVLAVLIYPVGSGILLSFREMRLTRPDLGTAFIGLRHYRELWSDPVFHISLVNTTIWALVGTTAQFVCGLISALALNRGLHRLLPGMRLARVLILLPWVMPSVVAGHVWALMLDSRLGVINDMLVRLGVLDRYMAFFADPQTALPAVLVVSTWGAFPFFTLFYLAALQGIPDDLYEAAGVDGAGLWLQFRHITWPMLVPIVVATIVLRMIGMVNAPDLLLVLTGGGPGHATQVLSLFAFQKAYAEFDFGYAAAVSVVMMLMLMAFTVVYVRISGVTKE
ncbi:MAG: sugar ABC transporter permease [bacterium]|nr:sugar ABC transporter permease [bacterium]